MRRDDGAVCLFPLFALSFNDRLNLFFVVLSGGGFCAVQSGAAQRGGVEFLKIT